MKHIPLRHIYRMFPYEFFEELHEEWNQSVPFHPVFSMMYTKHKESIEKLSSDEKKTLFEDYRREHKLFKDQNLIETDFDYIVPLMPYIKKDLIDKETSESTDPNRLDFLAIQYYDSSQKPIFHPDVRREAIREIPEILWDDPNLLIIIVETSLDGSTPNQMGILKYPDFLEEKLTETPDDETKKEE